MVAFLLQQQFVNDFQGFYLITKRKKKSIKKFKKKEIVKKKQTRERNSTIVRENVGGKRTCFFKIFVQVSWKLEPRNGF